MKKSVQAIPTEGELRATVRAWDPALPEDSRGFEAALVMFAALYVGGRNLAQLSRVTGVPYHRVMSFARNLRDAGVWTRDGKTVAAWDGAGAKGQVAFWTDVNVASGLFTKVRG